MNQFKQTGFTLLELMIALALGLVIVAAAITLFITGQRSYSVQQGMSENQSNANFGLNIIAKDVRHTNLDGASGGLNDRKKFGGIVLSSSTNSFEDTANGGVKLANLPTTIPTSSAPLVLLSRSNGQAVGTGNQWTGASNVELASGGAINSDQLVILYLPIITGTFDCEGNAINLADGYVIQRYFLRADANAATTEPNRPLALACDAGRIAVGDPTAISNYGDAGQIIMQRVDHFRVLLGIEQGTGAALRRRFVDVNTYMGFPSSATAVRPNIVSVQLGVLSRSTQAVGNDNVVKNDQEFTILDQTVKVKSVTGTTPPKYVRQVVVQTVALRNAARGG